MRELNSVRMKEVSGGDFPPPPLPPGMGPELIGSDGYVEMPGTIGQSYVALGGDSEGGGWVSDVVEGIKGLLGFDVEVEVDIDTEDVAEALKADKNTLTITRPDGTTISMECSGNIGYDNTLGRPGMPTCTAP